MHQAQPKHRPWELGAFGKLMKEHLHARGLKQGELAERAGISQETLSRAINGKQRAGAEVISKISAALDLSSHEKLRLLEAIEHDYSGVESDQAAKSADTKPGRGSAQRMVQTPPAYESPITVTEWDEADELGVQTVQLEVDDIVAEFELPFAARELARRLILEQARSICRILKDEFEGKQR